MTQRTLEMTIHKHPMEIAVEWPESVEDARTAYSDRGLLEIIHSGLEKQYRAFLVRTFAKLVKDNPKMDVRDLVGMAEVSAEKWTPPGPLPPSQADIVFDQIKALPAQERIRALTQSFMVLTPAEQVAWGNSVKQAQALASVKQLEQVAEPEPVQAEIDDPTAPEEDIMEVGGAA